MAPDRNGNANRRGLGWLDVGLAPFALAPLLLAALIHVEFQLDAHGITSPLGSRVPVYLFFGLGLGCAAACVVRAVLALARRRYGGALEIMFWIGLGIDVLIVALDPGGALDWFLD